MKASVSYITQDPDRMLAQFGSSGVNTKTTIFKILVKRSGGIETPVLTRSTYKTPDVRQ